MKWIFNLLKQRSTWAGLIMIVGAGGVVLTPDQSEKIIGFALAGVGLIDVFFNRG